MRTAEARAQWCRARRRPLRELDQVELRLLFFDGCANTRTAGDDVSIDTYWRVKDQHPLCS